jgi:hypothetical protein
MKLISYLLITFFTAFILQYWIISIITTSNINYVHHNTGKLYISLFAASIMGILEVIIYDSYHNTVSLFYYIGLGIAIYMFAFMYKTQMNVSEADYLRQMIEASSRDLLLSQNLVEHTDNTNMKTVATNIISKRKRDLDMMTKMLSEEKTPLQITRKDAFSYNKVSGL